MLSRRQGRSKCEEYNKEMFTAVIERNNCPLILSSKYVYYPYNLLL